jgi:predicted Zn finger-like uncharacterized protein
MNATCPSCQTVFRVDPAKVPAGGVRARCSVCRTVFGVGTAASSVAAPGAVKPTAPPPFEAPARPFEAASPPAPPLARAGEPETITSEPMLPWPEPPAAAAAPPPGAAPAEPPRRAPRLSMPAMPQAAPPPPRRTPTRGSPAMPGGFAPPFAAPEPAAPPTPARPPEPAAPPAPLLPEPPSAAPRGAGPEAPPVVAPEPVTVRTPAVQVDAPRGGTPGAPARVINPFLVQDPQVKARRLARALISDMVSYHPAKRAQGLKEGTLKDIFGEEIKKSHEEYVAQVGEDVARSTTYFEDALNEILAGGQQIF